MSPTTAAIGTALLAARLAGGEPATTLAESLWRADPAATAACAGAYVATEPLGTATTAETVDLTAAAIHSSPATIDARGGVLARQRQRALRTARLTFNRTTGIGRSEQPVLLQEPGLAARGQRLEFTADSGRVRLADAEYVLLAPQLRGAAAVVERDATGLRLGAATLTRCPPGDRAWALDAERIHVDAEAAAATLRGARLRLGRVPIFYAPYLRLPLRRQRASGWLFPRLGSNDGFDIALPYYLNLAPHYDATVAGRWIRDRGPGVEAEVRHLGQRTESALQAAWLHRDEDYDGTLSRSAFHEVHGAAATFAPASRYLLAARHRGTYGRLTTALDFTGVSDNDYFVDMGSDLAASARLLLERRAEAAYAHGALLVRLSVLDFQRLEPGQVPYRRLPEASLAYGGQLAGPFAWRIGGSWTAFERPGTGPRDQAGSRLHLEPALRLPLARSWGFLTIDARLRLTGYALVDGAADSERRPNRTVRALQADGGLFLERRQPGGGRQTLEPRLQYRYQSYAQQAGLPRFDPGRLTFSYPQLFRADRFAGIDRLGDANELAAGVATRLFDGRGRERLAAALGTIVHFSDRRVTLAGEPGPAERSRTSPLAGQLRGSLGRWRLTLAGAWDPGERRADTASFDLGYHHGQRLVNVGYRRRLAATATAARVEQTDVSVHWPLGRRWTAFGRWNHDWHFDRTVETLAGFGYASCCLDVKLLWHDTSVAPRNRLVAALPDAKRRRGVMVQFVFRGLAGVGGNVAGRLERSIKGYRSQP